MQTQTLFACSTQARQSMVQSRSCYPFLAERCTAESEISEWFKMCWYFTNDYPNFHLAREMRPAELCQSCPFSGPRKEDLGKNGMQMGEVGRTEWIQNSGNNENAEGVERNLGLYLYCFLRHLDPSFPLQTTFDEFTRLVPENQRRTSTNCHRTHWTRSVHLCLSTLGPESELTPVAQETVGTWALLALHWQP